MDVFKVTELEEFSPQSMIKKVPISDEKGNVILLFFGANQELPLHKHQNSHELFYVIEGEGMLMTGSEEQGVKGGDLALAPAGVMHGLKTDQSRMKVLAVQTPRP